MDSRAGAPVLDVSEASFAADVIERSNSVPVLVDFWAPWCGPCRTLGPVLEDLAEKSGGAWVLAKVNADEAPKLAGEHRVMGIPAVKAFYGGRVIDEFVGALPRYQIEAFLRTVLDSVSSERGVHAAREALGRKDPAAARVALASVPPDSPTADAAQTLAAILDRTAGAANASDGGASGGKDARARYERGAALVAGGDFAAALAEFLEIVRADRRFEDDAGRHALLALFTLLGDADPLTREYRSKLGTVLF